MQTIHESLITREIIAHQHHRAYNFGLFHIPYDRYKVIIDIVTGQSEINLADELTRINIANQEDLFNTLVILITNHTSLEYIKPLLARIENIDAMYCKYFHGSQRIGLQFYRDNCVTPVTLLSIAAICGNIDVAKLLLQMGANKDLIDTSNFNACDWAIVENNIEMVRFLHTEQCRYTKNLLIPNNANISSWYLL